MKWLNKLLGRDEISPENAKIAMQMAELDIEKKMAPMRQKWEDMKWDHLVEERAQRRFHEWKMDEIKRKVAESTGGWCWPELRIEPLFPSSVYMVYDIESDKPVNSDIHGRIAARTQQLIEEYEKSQKI